MKCSDINIQNEKETRAGFGRWHVRSWQSK
jgi:hypothetical protein